MTARLVGVIHLAPLPSSPRYAHDLGAIVDDATREARGLAEAGFDGAIVENFGDAPFMPGEVAPVTVAAMTRIANAVHDAAPGLALGVNVLRNDARAALAIAAVTGAQMIRVNVHAGTRVTDQGIVEGRAHATLRERRALELAHLKLWCDVAVKHAAPLGPRPLAEEARELAGRALADAVLVTGSGTGAEASSDDLATVLGAVACPVLIASGCTPQNIGALMAVTSDGKHAHGVIVGSTLKRDGCAGAPLDLERAKRFADAFHRAAS